MHDDLRGFSNRLKKRKTEYLLVVMSMETFVSCVGELATLGGQVLVVTAVRSPPGSPTLFLRSLGN